MIEQWSIKNFKSVAEKATVDFAPLTLFVGQNSAGKSTLIQSILLTSQTIQSTVASRAVILNGRTIKLGSFSDIKSNGSLGNSIDIGFKLGRSPYIGQSTAALNQRIYLSTDLFSQMKSVHGSYSFTATSHEGYSQSFEMQPLLVAGSVRFESKEAAESQELAYTRSQEDSVARLSRLDVTVVRLSDLSPLEFNLTQQAIPRYTINTPSRLIQAGVVLRHFLPTGIAAAYDAVQDEIENVFKIIVEPSAIRFRTGSDRQVTFALTNQRLMTIILAAFRSAPQNKNEYLQAHATNALDKFEESPSLGSLANAFSNIYDASAKKSIQVELTTQEAEIKELLRAMHTPSRRMEIRAFPVSESISYASDHLSAFFQERLKYLGPLRDEPKAIYPTGSSDPRDVGFKGEFTAAVLDNNKNSIITYVPSAHFPFSEQHQTEVLQVDLETAVGDWLNYLGIANRVASEDKGKLGHELTISAGNNNQYHDLTHVGVGVSQALPIVVLSLLADSGSTLIFEQPELHLHPKVQTRLADFFMSLILAGKQCVVETHSEYLIARLRYLSAKAIDVPISKLIKIYFVEKPLQHSQYREIEISDSGLITNWPDGFFDETEQNATLLVQAQIARAKARSKKRSGNAQ